jgi:hypothetical protein
MCDSSFFITLKSDMSLDYFPANKSNCFTNHLCRPIECDYTKCEVGLVEVFLTPTKNASVFSSQSAKEDFQISVQTGKIDFVQIPISKSPTPKIQEWITHINKTLEDNNMKKIIFSFQILDSSEVIKVKIVNNYTEYQLVTINMTAARALGFTQTDFGHGEFISNLVPSESLYIQLPQKGAMLIKFFAEPTITNVSLKNVDSVVEYFDLISAINVGFEDAKIPTEMSASGDEVHIEVKSGEPQRIQMSPKLNKVFGFAPDHVFKVVKEFSFENKIKLEEDGDKYIFLSNIVKPQYLGGTMMNVLRIFPKNTADSSSEIHIKFENVIYLPMSPTPIDNISFHISDEKREFMLLSDKPLTTTLHVRRRRE